MTRQKPFSEALEAFFQVSIPPQGYCRAGQKVPALNTVLTFQLFSPYKPTDTFVSAGLQFGLERDAKHHRGMPRTSATCTRGQPGLGLERDEPVHRGESVEKRASATLLHSSAEKAPSFVWSFCSIFDHLLGRWDREVVAAAYVYDDRVVRPWPRGPCGLQHSCCRSSQRHKDIYRKR